MVTVQQIKSIIGSPAANKDAVISYLIDSASDFIKEYCNIDNVSGMDSVMTKMILEDFNRTGNDGLSSQTFSGLTENYNQDYSKQIYKILNTHRRIKTL